MERGRLGGACRSTRLFTPCNQPAAAFINEIDDCTLPDYLVLLAGDVETKELLEQDRVDPGTDPEASNSVLQTWKISFNQILKEML